MPSERLPSDPLNLEAVDREIRINDLADQLAKRGMASMHVSQECSPEMHEEFLRNIVEYESAPLTSHFERLVKAGVELPEPDSLDDAALKNKLWEVVNALAEQGTLLSHTNHLSDRQLYEHLWGDSLRETEPDLPAGSGWTCHLDLIGGGSEEDIQIGLRYYDTEEQRVRWAKDFPDAVIPPHHDPPYDRDRHLPGAGPAVSDSGEFSEG